MDLKAVGNFMHEALKLDGRVSETASVVVGRGCLKLAVKRLVVARCVVGSSLLRLVRPSRKTRATCKDRRENGSERPTKGHSVRMLAPQSANVQCWREKTKSEGSL